MLRTLVVLVACATLAGRAQAAELARPPSLEELRARIAETLAANGVPGAGLALVDRERGVVYAGGVGLADRATRQPVTAETLFRAGSITKSLVALALVQLSERGRVSLDARVSDVAPELAIANRWAQAAPITVAMLLEHTAGFDDMHPNEMYAPLAAESAPLREILARNPASRVARWRPGSRFSYANPGYTVAAYLIEKVSGRPFADYVRDELLRPLGMTTAALRWSPEVDRHLARGYEDGDEPVPYRAIWHHPAGNLMVSARELAALVQLWLHKGRVGERALVSPAGLARSERAETADVAGTDTDYGLGNMGLVGRARLRGHGGAIDGFLAEATYLPDRGVGFVLLLNARTARALRAQQAIRRLIVAYLSPDAAPPPPRVDVPASELAACAGHYHLDNPRLQLLAFLVRLLPAFEVSLVDGQLRLRDPYATLSLPLVPLGQGRFRLPEDRGVHFRFATDRDGRRVLVGSGGHFVDEPAWLTPLFHYGARAVLWLLWSAFALPLVAWLARRRGEVALGARWPTLAAVSFFATPVLFVAGAQARALGELDPYTVGIFVTTAGFALSALACGLQLVARRHQPLPLLVRLHQGAVALAALAAAGYAQYYGLIGIRLWRY